VCASGSYCSDHGGKIFGACGNGSAFGWDAETGQLCETFQSIDSTDYMLSIHKDAKRPDLLVTGSYQGVVSFWDTRSGEATRSIVPTDLVTSKRNRVKGFKGINAIQADAESNFLMVADGAGFLHSFHIASGLGFASSRQTDCVVEHLLPRPGHFLAACSNCPTVKKFDLKCAEVGPPLATSNFSNYAMAQDPKQTMIFVAGSNRHNPEPKKASILSPIDVFVCNSVPSFTIEATPV